VVAAFSLLALVCALAPALAGWGGHPQGSFVSVHGAKLWVESEGQGEPLLLIAGGPGLAHDYFHPYFSRLAAHNRIVYFDAVGRGRSQSAPAYTFRRDVEDVEFLRQALGFKTFNIFGHSYGGLVALAYALEHPGAVQRLILSNSHWSGEEWQASNDAIKERIRREQPQAWKEIEQLRGRGVRAKSLAQVYRVPEDSFFHNRQASAEAPLQLNSNVYFAIAGDDADFVLGDELAKLDFRPRMKDLKMPVLVIMGRHDRITPPKPMPAVRSSLPAARVVVLEQSAHFPFIEETDKTMAAIDGFMHGLR
jgi:proline iminopeptidase